MSHVLRVLPGHVSEATARVVNDYPYGSLRTQIRYWIETTKHGDRLCAQTLNPKTGAWNKPHKSTYALRMVLVLNPENGHVESRGLHGSDGAAQLDAWLDLAGYSEVGHAIVLRNVVMAKAFAEGRAGWTINGVKQEPTPTEIACYQADLAKWEAVAARYKVAKPAKVAAE